MSLHERRFNGGDEGGDEVARRAEEQRSERTRADGAALEPRIRQNAEEIAHLALRIAQLLPPGAQLCLQVDVSSAIVGLNGRAAEPKIETVFISRPTICGTVPLKLKKK